ncbi:MAG TPA: helix-turn-helix domain-containing protein, partial [Polyangiaceae bacterium]|nr:helix-turn-helix domain-containing protein [Polyangiaceae bacterium]
MSPRKPDPKLSTLAAHGTLHPRARDVRDASFVDSEFFDPRDLVQVKYEMLRRVRSEGQAIAEVTERFGLSRPTFYKAQSDFEREGIAGLLPSKRGPHGPHKLTSQVMAFIARVVAREPELDAPTIAEHVEREFGVHVHPRSI